jgi:hypothetical protein
MRPIQGLDTTYFYGGSSGSKLAISHRNNSFSINTSKSYTLCVVYWFIVVLWWKISLRFDSSILKNMVVGGGKRIRKQTLNIGEL